MHINHWLDYYHEQSNDPNNTEHERILWKQLADELADYLKETKSGNETLF